MPPPETGLRLDLAARHAELLKQLLAEHVPGAEVWALGSRVHCGAHEGSDLDLIVRDADPPGRPVEGAGPLREALRDSLLPMTVDLHDRALLPPGFRAEIERSHLRIA